MAQLLVRQHARHHRFAHRRGAEYTIWLPELLKAAQGYRITLGKEKKGLLRLTISGSGDLRLGLGRLAGGERALDRVGIAKHNKCGDPRHLLEQFVCVLAW